MGLLGAPWGVLQALLGVLGAFLGPSWAAHEALWGDLGAILRPQGPIGGERARRQKTLHFRKFLKVFGLLEVSLGGSLTIWGRLEAVLEPLGSML